MASIQIIAVLALFDWEVAHAFRLAYEQRRQTIERRLLDDFMVGASGLVCDLGCGRGAMTAYLHAQGREVVGADLSQGKVTEAQRLHPDVLFVHVDMQRLPFEDDSLAGIVALYLHGLVQHNLSGVFHKEATAVLRELARVLRPTGQLLVGFLRGEEAHVTWNGEDITLGAHFCTPQEMIAWLTQVGFTAITIIDRMPDPDTEEQPKIIYINARKNN